MYFNISKIHKTLGLHVYYVYIRNFYNNLGLFLFKSSLFYRRLSNGVFANNKIPVKEN